MSVKPSSLAIILDPIPEMILQTFLSLKKFKKLNANTLLVITASLLLSANALIRVYLVNNLGIYPQR